MITEVSEAVSEVSECSSQVLRDNGRRSIFSRQAEEGVALISVAVRVEHGESCMVKMLLISQSSRLNACVHVTKEDVVVSKCFDIAPRPC